MGIDLILVIIRGRFHIYIKTSILSTRRGKENRLTKSKLDKIQTCIFRTNFQVGIQITLLHLMLSNYQYFFA